MERPRKLIRYLGLYGLLVTDTRLKITRSKAEEILSKMLKLDTSGLVEHRFNTKENFGLNHEGGTCVDIFYNLLNHHTTTNQDPYGLGKWR